MKKYQTFLLGLSLALNGLVLGAFLLPHTVLPEVSVEEFEEFEGRCAAQGGWRSSTDYISQQRVIHVCRGVVNGKMVVLDVTYR